MRIACTGICCEMLRELQPVVLPLLRYKLSARSMLRRRRGKREQAPTTTVALMVGDQKQQLTAKTRLVL